MAESTNSTNPPESKPEQPADLGDSTREASVPERDTFFDQFFTRPGQAYRTSSQTAEKASPTSVLGDYELLGVLGEGGMGIVFRARQRGADRVVALKLIRLERLTGCEPEAIERLVGRFHTEARAAARLEHDHIVTVYDVGEAEGQHYYSMRLVDGPSLAHVLQDGPLDNRRAAVCLQSVASAVHEAHRRGILHRDLKPQNVLLEAESDRAFVADFGLAKLVEQKEDLTRAGEVVGTPAYMSPEQARDSGQVTERSDVYALGATLYHALTGRPVFQAATAIETLRQAVDEIPVPPRTLNAAVDRDLNTICLKCLEKDPHRRYPSAGAVAEDLRRYLEGQPILARPVGVLGRLWRWSHRNPVAAGFAGAAAGCLMAAFVALAFGYVSASIAHRRSEESFRQALDMVNVFFTRVSEETLLDQPGLQPLRRDLLLQAREYYQRFLAQRAGDTNIRQELAATQYRVGLITAQIDSAKAALPFFTRAYEEQKKLAADNPDSPLLLTELGNTLNEKGKALFTLRHLEESLATFQESQQVRERLVDLDATQYKPARKLANTVMNIGVVLQAQGKPEQALRCFQRAQSMREKLYDLHGDDEELLRDLAKAYYNLGNLYYEKEDWAGARKNFQLGVKRFETLSTLRTTIDDRYALALCYDCLADLDSSSERRVALYRRALNELETLAAENPRVKKLEAAVARTFMDLGKLELDEGNGAAARDSLQRAQSHLARLVEQNSDASYRRDLVVCLQNLAATDLKTDRTRAANYLQQAGQHITALTAQFPEDASFHELLRTNETLLKSL